MNRIFFSVLLLFSAWCSAQSYIGYDSDNYSGIHGVLANPASMADSRLRADINLFSFSAFGTSTYAEVDFRKAVRSLYDEDTEFTEENGVKYIGRDRKNSGLGNIDILGPSFMFSINEEHSAAFYTRARAFININEVDGRYQPLLDEGLANRTEPILFVDENSFGAALAMAEFGVSYARVLKNEKQNFLKAGLTFKYIKPLFYGGFGFVDAIFNYNPNDASQNDIFGEFNIETSHSLDPEDNGLRNGGGQTDIALPSKNLGYGFDLGFIYEYRPKFRKNISKDNVIKQVKFRHMNTYKLRLGFSLLDIGSMKFKSGTKESYNLELDNILDDLRNDNPDTDEELRVSLPSTLRLEVDWAISKKFYLNGLTRLSLISKEKRNAIRYANQFTINPRLETRWLSVFSPFSVTQYSGVQWGLGTRVGPLFFGSGNLLGSLVDRETRAFDVYLGLKIPLLHKIPKTKEAKEAIKRFECPDGCPEEKDPEVKRLEGKIKGQVERKLKRLDGYKGGTGTKVKTKKKQKKRLEGYKGLVK